MSNKKQSLKESINDLLMDKVGNVILPTTIKGQIKSSWLAFNKFAPIELGTSMLLYGASQSGKSVMMMKLGAAVQQMGGLFICFNTEAANRDTDFLKKAVPELKYDDIAFYQPDTIEYVFDCINLIIDNAEIDGPPIFMAVDSISSCATTHELGVAMEKAAMEGARIAQILSNGLRQSTCRLSKKPVVLCLISQERENIGMYVSEKKKPTGGSAPRFHASTTIYTRGHHALYKNATGTDFVTRPKNPTESSVGKECSMELQKSRFSPGGNRMNYFINYESGISEYDGLLDIFLQEGTIIQSGGWCSYGEEKFRKADFVRFIEEHPQILETIK